MSQNMFYGATPNTFTKAKALRANETNEEKILWQKLRSNQILGLKFRRQHPIDIYVADFYCHKLKLVIEIDGDSHLKSDQKEYDRGREAVMRDFGIKTIRFSNSDINNRLGEVLIEIVNECKRLLNSDSAFSGILEAGTASDSNNLSEGTRSNKAGTNA